MKYTLAINMAMTLDGKVVRPDGKWYGLSSRKDKQKMDFYRSRYKALLVGKNSIVNDNPVIQLRYSEGEAPRPIILIRTGTVPTEKRIFHTPKKPLIFCTEKNYKELDNLKDLADLEVFSGEELDPGKVLEKLLILGYSEILLEGGPTLNYSFFSQDLINRIHLTIVPFLIGQNNLHSIVNGKNPFSEFDKPKWDLESSEVIENEVFLTYTKKTE